MRWMMAMAVAVAAAGCGVDGPPEKPTYSVNTTVGAGSRGTNASVTTDWISGRVSTHVGAAF